MPRLVAIFFAVLLCIPAIALAQGDPAYVDSPAGRAVADPARADGGSVSVTASAVPAPMTSTSPTGMPNMTGMAQPQTQMELAALMAQQPQAQQAMLGQPGAAQPGNPFGAPPGDLYGAPQARGMGQAGGYPPGAGVSVPGYGTQPGYGGAPAGYGNAPSSGDPMQQIGGGLMQDAAGVLNARLRRDIYGPNGPVVVPAPPPGGGVPGSGDTGW